ncbi:scabin-related ADP-ribosyltransferase [Streptomyces sp. SAI-229]|uniref:scabin-related ADP-ribosyltransferase n=1 Tax=Streptomyces sp. SAI-229 TaxID=3377731 RepID=UPI003C7B1B7F
MPSQSLDGLFIALTGMEWPDLDTAEVERRVVLPHRDVEQGLREFQELVGQVTNSVQGSVSGRWSASYVRAMSSFSSGTGADYVQRLADTAKQLGDAGENAVGTVRYTRGMIIAQLVQFVIEWAITLVMAVFNPIAALMRQALLRAVYRAILRSLVFRMVAAVGSHVVLNVGLAAATDVFVRWALARQGHAVPHGGDSLKQAVGFGAMQGLFGAFVPLAGGALGGLIGKNLGRDALKGLRDTLDDALDGLGRPAGADVLRDAAARGGVRDAAGQDVVKGAVRQGLSGRGGAPLADTFGAEVALGAAGAARGLHLGGPGRLGAKDFSPDGFASGMGEVFARRLDGVVDAPAARAMGEEWARAFTGNFGTRGLGDALAASVRELPQGLRHALSDEVARAFGTNWGRKAGAFVGDTLGWGAATNLAEGTYNYLTTGRFTTSWGTFASGAIGAMLGHAGGKFGGRAGAAIRQGTGPGTPPALPAGTPVNTLTSPTHPLNRAGDDIRQLVRRLLPGTPAGPGTPAPVLPPGTTGPLVGGITAGESTTGGIAAGAAGDTGAPETPGTGTWSQGTRPATTGQGTGTGMGLGAGTGAGTGTGTPARNTGGVADRPGDGADGTGTGGEDDAVYRALSERLRGLTVSPGTTGPVRGEDTDASGPGPDTGPDALGRLGSLSVPSGPVGALGPVPTAMTADGPRAEGSQTRDAAGGPDVPDRGAASDVPDRDVDDTAGADALRRLEGLTVPSQAPPRSPVQDAPSAPVTRPVSPVEQVRGTVSRLESLAREVGMPGAQREVFAREARAAAEAGDWNRAADEVAAFRDGIRMQDLRGRYEAFTEQVEGGFERLEPLGVDHDQWQSRADAVRAAWNTADPDVVDGALRDYTALIERHVPADVLTGGDLPTHHDPELARIRQELISGAGGRDTLGEYQRMRPLSDSLRERLDQAVSGTRTQQLEAVLRQRMLTADTPEQAAAAERELRDLREAQELSARLDALRSEAPADGPDGVDGLQRRLDALRDDTRPDEHEDALRRQVDEATTDEGRAQATRELQDYRDLRRLRQRLDTLRQDDAGDDGAGTGTGSRSEEELRRRFAALTADETGAAADLRRQVLDGTDEHADTRKLHRLQELLDRQEAQRLRDVARLEQELHALTEQRQAGQRALLEGLRTPATAPAAPGRPRSGDENGEGGHGTAPAEETRGTAPAADDGRGPDGIDDRIADVRRRLDEARTESERLAGLRRETGTALPRLERDGHLARITDRGLSARNEQRDSGSGPRDLAGRLPSPPTTPATEARPAGTAGPDAPREASDTSEAPPLLDTVGSPVLPDVPDQAPATPARVPPARETPAAEGTAGQGAPRPDVRDSADGPDGLSADEDVRAAGDVRPGRSAGQDDTVPARRAPVPGEETAELRRPRDKDGFTGERESAAAGEATVVPLPPPPALSGLDALRRLGGDDAHASGDAGPDVDPAVDLGLVHEGDRGSVVPSLAEEKLWRFSDHPPEVVFTSGFTTDVPGLDSLVLLDHWVHGKVKAQYVATTRDRELWYLNRRYRYGITPSRGADPTGVDVAATLARLNVRYQLSWEREVAFTGHVDAAAVTEVYDRQLKRTGVWDPTGRRVVWHAGDHRDIASVARPSADVQPALPVSGRETPEPSAGSASGADPALTHPDDAVVLVGSQAGQTLWRFSDTGPQDVFAAGFAAAGVGEVISVHEWGSDDREGASESATRDHGLWYGAKRYRYWIDPVLGGDSAGTALGRQGTGDEPEGEQDTFTGSVDARAVVSVYDMEERRTGVWDPETSRTRWEPGDRQAAVRDIASGPRAGRDDHEPLPADLTPRRSGAAIALGQVLGAGEVRTDRWRPFGTRPGRPAEGAEAFVFEPGEGTPPTVLRPAASGERTDVGYDWIWHRDEASGSEVLRLLRRIHLMSDGATPQELQGLQESLAQAVVQILNAPGYRLPRSSSPTRSRDRWPRDRAWSSTSPSRTVPSGPTARSPCGPACPARTGRWFRGPGTPVSTLSACSTSTCTVSVSSTTYRTPVCCSPRAVGVRRRCHRAR